ncbi:MAG: GMC family oxidoreductase [Candidatus Nanopelagicales bacterium]|nr:GMC family oxidoreductase [Candidatus Nanopelagicales bacterium]
MLRDFDVLVIGSGFGGSVAALRLVEKGYRVGVLEAGRRFEDADFPKTSWDLRRFIWAPKLKMYGIQRIHLLKDVAVLAGAGVGGGSLVYANTLYKPGPAFFQDPQWAQITDWESELDPYYDQARRMLGVETNPTMTPSDQVMKQVADEMGVGETFTMTPVGVHFGAGRGVESPDPYFGGVGPARTGCIECGECMTGCRHNAKNTLPKNYLGLAEKAGARVIPMTTAIGLDEDAEGGFIVSTVRTGTWSHRHVRTFSADQVIVAAGAFNTQKLLLRMRDEGRLARLSKTLGRLSRTNSESILGAVSSKSDTDFTQGVAITSSWYPDPNTHVEPVRYGKGSNSMGLLQSVLTVPRVGIPRWRTWAGELVKQKDTTLRLLDVRRWSERSVISLVMQPVDNSLTLTGTRGRFGRWRMTTNQSESTPAPTYMPVAQDVVKRIAERIGGVAGSSVFENIDAALTAHFVGGCVIGESAEHGVIDPYQRVFGYPRMHVLDGSAITANLGVNPSLTITAQAERAVALWPNKGKPDLRPAQGEVYVQVRPTQPESPLVPSAAPGALRLPIVNIIGN